MTHEVVIRQADWRTEAELLMRVREEVFVREQRVPIELEWDGKDDDALHVLALSPDRTPVGCGRLLKDAQIGRMAVIREWRERGIGGLLLRELLMLAHDNGLPPPFLHAQLTALSFYQRYGFEAEGEIFMEADIPHRLMRRIDC